MAKLLVKWVKIKPVQVAMVPHPGSAKKADG